MVHALLKQEFILTATNATEQSLWVALCAKKYTYVLPCIPLCVHKFGEAFRLNPLSQVPRSKLSVCLSVCLGHYKQFMSKMKQRNSNGGKTLPVTHNPLIGASPPRSSVLPDILIKKTY